MPPTTGEAGGVEVKVIVWAVWAVVGTMTWTMSLAPASVNHRLPSGPVTMSVGLPPAFGPGNSVTAPDVVISPIWLAKGSVNHRLPSGRR